MNPTTQHLRLYGHHGLQHLNRVRLSHLLALRALASAHTIDGDEQVASLAKSGFDVLDPSMIQVKLGTSLHELHLTSLKTEFELFLNRVVTVAFRGDFAGLRKRLPKDSRIPLVDIAEAYFEGTEKHALREFVLDRHVPTHGLPDLSRMLHEATGLRISTLPGVAGTHAWPQVVVAFEVRHLLEHKDGRVDGSFRRKILQFWPATSWGSRLSLTEARVPVAEHDFIATFEAMSTVVGSLIPPLLAWSEGLPPGGIDEA